MGGGAFGEATDKTMELFNDSLPFDKRLWAADLAGSKAYAAALTEAGVIDQDQSTKMRQGLSDVRKEWAENKFVEIEGDDTSIRLMNGGSGIWSARTSRAGCTRAGLEMIRSRRICDCG